jgi:hypothetical protein
MGGAGDEGLLWRFFVIKALERKRLKLKTTDIGM